MPNKVNADVSKVRDQYFYENPDPENHKSYEYRLLTGVDTEHILDLDIMDESIDPRIYFYDSSIWHKIAKECIKNYPANSLKALNDDIWLKHPSSIENRAFFINLFNSAYLMNTQNISQSSHGKYITPFKFHSETRCRIKTEEILKSKKLNDIIWKVLILDDHSIEKYKGLDKNKFDRIKEVLNLVEYKSDATYSGIIYAIDRTNVQLIVDCESYHNKTIDYESYDIILIDYLFIKDNSATYGSELISEICEQFKNPKHGRFWFFPISAYNDAFLNQLANDYIELTQEKFKISQGGNPICTPYLFKLRFLYFLNLQLQEYKYDQDVDFYDFINDFSAQDIPKLKVDFLRLIRVIHKYENLETKFSMFAHSFVNKHFKFSKEAMQKFKSFIYHIQLNSKDLVFFQTCYATCREINDEDKKLKNIIRLYYESIKSNK